MKTSIKLAQQNVQEARIRLDLFRSLAGRLREEPTTASETERLLATIEQCVRLQEDIWESCLKLEDFRSTLTSNDKP